ncbi:helix-turn-helix domain-containing protein [Paenibacillus mesophilus]|uniref:helix-turn-helix domain-containing protein n=1 Tax=Paenibacillus mesophilus TaxID=2582849 RepID=UPI0013052B7D|nr:helix-turn-helix domain-containing protein [Paenibacillus mesophilus]
MTTIWSVRRNTFFTKLLLAFLVVGAVPFLFHLVALNFFIDNIRTEIVKNTDSRMNYTVSNYEDHFLKLEEAVAPLLNNPNIAAIADSPDKYGYFSAVNGLKDEFARLASNANSLFVHNVFIAFENKPFVIDKTGLVSVPDMFGRNYANPMYGERFWAEPFADRYRFRLFPAVRFKKEQLDGTIQESESYFPVIFKHKINHSFYIGTFVDADAVFRSYSLSGGDLFQLLDRSGRLIYSSDPLQPTGQAIVTPVPLAESSGFFAGNGNYVFGRGGKMTGLTYVNIVPNSDISAQISRLNAVLYVMLSLSVLSCVALSVLFGFKFKQPIQRLVHSLQRMNPNIQLSSTIAEFNMIGDRLRHMIVSADTIREDLRRKTKMLEKYGYLDLVKRINVNHKDVHSLVDTSRSSYFVLFQIERTPRFRELGIEEQQLTTHIVEFINLSMQQRFPGSVTAQSEKDIVFSIVFAERDDSGGLNALLARMKQVFDRDCGFYYLTIAANPALRSASEFTAAYEDGMDLLRQRRLNGETQIITRKTEARQDLWFSPPEEREFDAHLQSGSEAGAIELVRRIMQRLQRNEAVSWQYRQFAHTIATKLLMALTAHQIDAGEWSGDRPLYEQLKEFMTVDECSHVLESWVRKTAEWIAAKSGEKDPILDYVRSYVEKHYGEEIQQETVAGKLNISSGYMCSYIKSRSGETFTDLLNEVRVSKAKQILEGTDCKIHEVAARVGYRNANSFTRMFRKLTGLTPLEYRRGKRIAEG